MIRTVEQYLQSLDDGRQIWTLGEKVKDVRSHPTIQSIIRASAMDYVLPNDPRLEGENASLQECGQAAV